MLGVFKSRCTMLRAAKHRRPFMVSMATLASCRGVMLRRDSSHLSSDVTASSVTCGVTKNHGTRGDGGGSTGPNSSTRAHVAVDEGRRTMYSGFSPSTATPMNSRMCSWCADLTFCRMAASFTSVCTCQWYSGLPTSASYCAGDNNACSDFRATCGTRSTSAARAKQNV